MSAGAQPYKASKPKLVERQNTPKPIFSTCQFYYGRDLYCGEPKENNGHPYCPACTERTMPVAGAKFPMAAKQARMFS